LLITHNDQEEDFHSSTFGLNLLEANMEEVNIYESIARVEADLAKQKNVEALLARIRFAKVRSKGWTVCRYIMN